MTWKVQIYCR